MKKLLIFAIFTIVILLTGCNGIGVRGSGILKDEVRDIDNFDVLEVSGFYYVTVECGKEPGLQIIGDDNLIPLIKTEVRGNTLHIWNKKHFSLKRKIKIIITTEDLTKVETSGASSIYVKNINNDNFDVEASGAGNLKFSGKTQEVNLALSGAVNLDASKLEAEDVQVEISGASNAEVFAKDALRAEISGVGNIEYHGSPKSVKRRISGLGSITQR